jgi:pimeloyl-ACP methyl ester carboxylesterase
VRAGRVHEAVRRLVVVCVPPTRPFAGTLFLHGNAQTVFDWALVRQDLAPLDCGLLLLDYPGYCKSTGHPSEASLNAAGPAYGRILREWVDGLPSPSSPSH